MARFLTDLMCTSARWGRVRTEDEVAECFAGLEMCAPEPGNIREWRPDLIVPGAGGGLSEDVGDETIWEFGGVARKP